MKNLCINNVFKVIVFCFLCLSFSSLSFSQNVRIDNYNENHKVDNSQKWSNSNAVDEGLSTGTVILIGVGIAAAVLAIVLIVNSSSDDNSDDGQEKKIIQIKN